MHIIQYCLILQLLYMAYNLTNLWFLESIFVAFNIVYIIYVLNNQNYYLTYQVCQDLISSQANLRLPSMLLGHTRHPYKQFSQCPLCEILNTLPYIGIQWVQVGGKTLDVLQVEVVVRFASWFVNEKVVWGSRLRQ